LCPGRDEGKRNRGNCERKGKSTFLEEEEMESKEWVTCKEGGGGRGYGRKVAIEEILAISVEWEEEKIWMVGTE
jgi:hypothetical protein